MSKIELTISAQYVPDWGVYEGIREFVQNALDAEQDGHHMVVSHNGKTTLTIASRGVQLDRSIWLIGTSSKRDGDYRGCFGEGAKLGALALLRAGRKVTIRNGEEDWIVRLEESTVFPGQQVLTVSTRKSRSPGNDFRVEVECTAQEWASYQRNFLALMPDTEKIESPKADRLDSPELIGRIYVKGILVEEKADCAFGWNLHDAKTDRDRRMVDQFSFKYGTNEACVSFLENEKVGAAQLLAFLEGGHEDAEGLAEFWVPFEIRQALKNAWRERYGSNAIPVRDAGQKAMAGHLGRVGVIANSFVCRFFRNDTELDLEQLRQNAKAETLRTYGIEDLNPIEKAIYETGTAIVGAAGDSLGFEPLNGRLQIVDFRDEAVKGLHARSVESHIPQISIARSVLQSLEEFLQVLVHELAHDSGDDGDVGHERAEGRLFARIVSRAIQGYVPTPA